MQEPIDTPKCLSTVFAVITANPLRNAIGSVIFGYDKHQLNPWPLMVLDWELFQFDEMAGKLTAQSARVKELSKRCGAVFPSDTICIEPGAIGSTFEPALAESGHESIELIPLILSRLTLPELAAGAALYVHRGLVMLTKAADEKESQFQGTTRNHLVSQMTSFGITAAEIEASELFRAWCIGILMSLEQPPRD